MVPLDILIDDVTDALFCSRKKRSRPTEALPLASLKGMISLMPLSTTGQMSLQPSQK
jgi:hypothetical protein